jgi:hypothetical protein
MPEGEYWGDEQALDAFERDNGLPVLTGSEGAVMYARDLRFRYLPVLDAKIAGQEDLELKEQALLHRRWVCEQTSARTVIDSLKARLGMNRDRTAVRGFIDQGGDQGWAPLFGSVGGVCVSCGKKVFTRKHAWARRTRITCSRCGGVVEPSRAAQGRFENLRTSSAGRVKTPLEQLPRRCDGSCIVCGEKVPKLTLARRVFCLEHSWILHESPKKYAVKRWLSVRLARLPRGRVGVRARVILRDSTKVYDIEFGGKKHVISDELHDDELSETWKGRGKTVVEFDMGNVSEKEMK